jgi:hypothetical protein
MILVAVLCVLGMTGNPLALLGIMMMQSIPIVDLASALAQQREDFMERQLAEEEEEEDHQIREVGFNAKHDE